MTAPVVSGKGWEMRLGDCRNLLLDFGRAEIDHVIADPPYTAHVHANLLSTTAGHTSEVEATFDHLTNLDFVRECTGTAKRWSLFFCAIEQLGEYQAANPQEWIRSGIYRKQRAMPQMSGDRPDLRFTKPGLTTRSERIKKGSKLGKERAAAASSVSNLPGAENAGPRDGGQPVFDPGPLAQRTSELEQWSAADAGEVVRGGK